jgi:hypothetical protein
MGLYYEITTATTLTKAEQSWPRLYRRLSREDPVPAVQDALPQHGHLHPGGAKLRSGVPATLRGVGSTTTSQPTWAATSTNTLTN